MIYLDDGFPNHPKVVAAGGDAAWLYLCGLAHCRRYMTGGLIPKVLVPRLSDRRHPDRLAVRLVKVALWEDHDAEHYMIHDYGPWNASEDQQRTNREQKARGAAKARWGRSGNAQAVAGAGAQANPEQCLSTTPTHTTRPVSDSRRARDPSAVGSKFEDPNPNVRKLAERMDELVRAHGGRSGPAGCLVVARWAAGPNRLDFNFADERIGAAVARNGRPKSPRYFVPVLAAAAEEAGVDLGPCPS